MATGFLDDNGDAYIELEVSNPLGWKSKLRCLIDTGFTGFLSIPILDAFPIGLLLVSTIPVALADGSVHYKLTCLGMVHLEYQSEVGMIIIEPESKQVLVGMEFLRKFKKKLVIDPQNGTVELLPSDKPDVQPPPVLGET